MKLITNGVGSVVIDWDNAQEPVLFANLMQARMEQLCLTREEVIERSRYSEAVVKQRFGFGPVTRDRMLASTLIDLAGCLHLSWTSLLTWGSVNVLDPAVKTLVTKAEAQASKPRAVKKAKSDEAILDEIGVAVVVKWLSALGYAVLEVA